MSENTFEGRYEELVEKWKCLMEARDKWPNGSREYYEVEEEIDDCLYQLATHLRRKALSRYHENMERERHIDACQLDWFRETLMKRFPNDSLIEKTLCHMKQLNDRLWASTKHDLGE